MPKVFKLDKSSNDLNTISLVKDSLSQSKKITVSKGPTIPSLQLLLVAAIFAFGLFIVGYDQGHVFSVVLGDQAFNDLYIHELTHDMRDAAGFPGH